LWEAPKRRREGLPPSLVFDCNGHAISLSARDPGYRSDLLSADIIHADGAIVVAVSRCLNGPAIRDRSATTDLFLDSLAPAAAKGLRYFLLGGTELVNAACAAIIEQRAPGLIVGRHHGFLSGEQAECKVVDLINQTGADVLWVGLGKPREQSFCVRYREDLRAGWMVTCGGLFNYVTGDYPRAPQWMQRAGLEWLHRMATNPRQLAWRYLTTNPHALWLMWKGRHA
jgi:N-acetylglucosaminyldiphosphoundecaprenol N-acetyl-beta-D-mannosaminyltransferase